MINKMFVWEILGQFEIEREKQSQFSIFFCGCKQSKSFHVSDAKVEKLSKADK